MTAPGWSEFLNASPQGQLFKQLRDNFWLQVTPVIHESMFRKAHEEYSQADFKNVEMKDIPLRALHLLILVEEIVLLGVDRAEGIHHLEELIKAITDEKLKHAISLYLLTRFPEINEWLANGIFLSLESVEYEHLKAQACRSTRALWLMISGLLVNRYSVDAQTLLCDTPGFIEGCALSSLNPILSSYMSAPKLADWAFVDVVEAFPTTLAWNSLIASANFQIKVSRCLSQLFNTLGDFNSQDSQWTLARALSIMRTVLILSVNSVALCTKLFTNASFVANLLEQILNILSSPIEEFAVLNLIWLHKNEEFVNQQGVAANEDPTGIHFNSYVIISGNCLALLHLIGRSVQGAELLYSEAPVLISGLKRLVNIQGMEILKKLRTWDLLVGIIRACVTGCAIDESSVPDLTLSLKRLRHNNLLLPCTYCSRLVLGSKQLKICGECHLVRYCGRECQQKDWHSSHMWLCMAQTKRRVDGVR